MSSTLPFPLVLYPTDHHLSEEYFLWISPIHPYPFISTLTVTLGLILGFDVLCEAQVGHSGGDVPERAGHLALAFEGRSQ